jgi:hypothetical protein
MLDSFLHSFTSIFSIILPNCIGGVMVSMLASRAVDHVFEPQFRIFYHLSSVCCQWTFESSPQRPWWTIWTDTLQKHYSIQADIEWLLMAVIVPIFSGIKVSCCSIFSFLCNILWTIVFFFLPLYCCIHVSASHTLETFIPNYISTLSNKEISKKLH